ncbi:MULTISPECIES: hypothetical protein [Kocuria]|uniref:Uncharacterized protein n=1 Tax=Kocuria subflava TaxID=1736139 RepID=A0A846TMW3_9MICC|nr:MULTISPECIES: hypothetical protein [Kocuria]NKE09783.1 hypothetical protein [Kocuria subflava]
MKRDPAAGHAALQFKVQDSRGQNLLLNRDILRRTYGAIKAIGQYFYRHANGSPDTTPDAEGLLSISFTESQDGLVTFIADQRPAPPVVRRRRLSDLWRHVPTNGEANRAQTALQNTMLLIKAAAFSLEVGGTTTHAAGHGNLVDLVSTTDSQRLRLPVQVVHGLMDAAVQAHLRELWSAVSEEGVGSIVVGSDPHTPESRNECVIPATDVFVEFQAGGDLLR